MRYLSLIIDDSVNLAKVTQVYQQPSSFLCYCWMACKSGLSIRCLVYLLPWHRTAVSVLWRCIAGRRAIAIVLLPSVTSHVPQQCVPPYYWKQQIMRWPSLLLVQFVVFGLVCHSIDSHGSCLTPRSNLTSLLKKYG